MHGDAHHRRLRLDPVIEALPGLADVITAEDPAVAAAECRAESGIKHLRIMRRGPQIAAIGQRREPADLDVAPVRPAIVAADETHAVGQKHRARCRRTAGERVAVQHPFDLGLTDDAALVFLLFGEAQQILCAILPALAAVAAAHRAIGLDAGKKIVGMGRVDIEAHDPARKCHMHPVGEPRIGQFLPVIAVILAAVDADRPATGINGPAVGRIYGDTPDVGLRIRQREPLPAAAAIGAAKRPLYRSAGFPGSNVIAAGPRGEHSSLERASQPQSHPRTTSCTPSGSRSTTIRNFVSWSISYAPSWTGSAPYRRIC